ncbi:MAG: hypothetical protein ABFS41_18870 [Myxococcota bacterium]
MPSRGAPFRPRFTLTIVYLIAFFLLYALAFALPDLIAGAGELGPGPAELTPEEQARATEIARNALGGGRILIAVVASVLTVGFALWRRLRPGLT